MSAVKPQAARHSSERQNASINPRKLRIEETGVDCGFLLWRRFRSLGATFRAFPRAITAFLLNNLATLIGLVAFRCELKSREWYVLLKSASDRAKKCTNAGGQRHRQRAPEGDAYNALGDVCAAGPRSDRTKQRQESK